MIKNERGDKGGQQYVLVFFETIFFAISGHVMDLEFRLSSLSPAIFRPSRD